MSLDRYAGAVEAMDGMLLSGWAIDRAQPLSPCLVDVYINSFRVGTVLAELERRNLAGLSPEDTRRGFLIDLSGNYRPGCRVEVYFGGTNIRVPMAPRLRVALGPEPIDPEGWRFAARSAFVPIPESSLITHVSGASEGDLEENYRTIGSVMALDIYNVLGENACDLAANGFHLLDLGCGCGRIATFLSGFLERGRYSGFDVWQGGISWAQRNISSVASNFSFAVLPADDVPYHGSRGPALALARIWRGGLSWARRTILRCARNTSLFGQSADNSGYQGRRGYPLPLARESVDAVACVSLFTHLGRVAMRFYLAEIGRVLRPGGLLYLTAFLRDPEVIAQLRGQVGASAEFVEEGEVTSFTWEDGILDSHVDLGFLREEIARNGMELIRVRYGVWRGSNLATVNAAAWQDLLVARRR